MTVLHITSSANPGPSTSTQLGEEIAAKIGGTVVTRDTNRIPAIDSDWITANFAGEDRSADQKARLAFSDTLISEVKAADTLIISAPIYNFSVPSTLKAWIDHICRGGITFRYTADGPVGLLEGKRAVLALTSGGTKVGSDIDFASGYLRQVMGFIGIDDVEIVAADRIMADQDAALKTARAAIAAL